MKRNYFHKYFTSPHLTAQNIRFIVQYFSDKVVESTIPFQRRVIVVLVKVRVHFQQSLTQDVVAKKRKFESRFSDVGIGWHPFSEVIDVPSAIEWDLLDVRVMKVLVVVHLLVLSRAEDFDSIVRYDTTIEAF